MASQTDKAYLKYSWFLFVMVFLVIAAGGIVRMTGSGMGCPDWPKCFGYLIPPTDEAQVLWQPNTEYTKGTIIVQDEALWKAKENFTTGLSYNPIQWNKYEKHDYAIFNVYHTWIEYVNRLLGALLGLFILFYFAWSIRKYWKTRKDLVLISFLLLIAVGIQGWLGKVVVDKNLDVVKVTIHMVGALVIAALPLMSITRITNKKITVHSGIKWATLVLIGVILLQIILGTQVREEIDIISKSLNFEQREIWISMLGGIFLVHRSFSWLILLASGYVWWFGRKNMAFSKYSNLLIINVLSIILLGVIMAYFAVPSIAQPLHLILACALLMQVFYNRLIIE